MQRWNLLKVPVIGAFTLYILRFVSKSDIYRILLAGTVLSL